jgi:hypothetical protein
MSYAQFMADGFPRLDRAHTVRNGRLVETTPEVNREVAESAMLLSQGARRAIEMKREAAEADADAVPVAAD